MTPVRAEAFFTAVARFAVTGSRGVVAAAVVATALAAWYTVANLGVNTDTGYLFSDDLPWRKTYLDVADAFPGYSDNLILVVEANGPEMAEMAAERLAAALGERRELFEWVYRPGAGAFFDHHRLLYLDTAELETLGDDLAAVQPLLGSLARSPTLATLLDISARAVTGADAVETSRLEPVLSRLDAGIAAALTGAHAPVSWREFITNRDTTGADRRQIVIVKPRLDFEQLLPLDGVIRELRRVALALGIDEAHGMRLRVTGELAMSHEEIESVSRGAATGSVAAVLMVACILLLGLRSARLALASIVTLLAGLALTAAFAAFAVGHLNLISVAFGVLYIGLGIDFSVHMCLRYRELMSRGLAHEDALVQASGQVGGTLFVCALTTGIGFLAFVGTDFLGVSELGLISGAGMFISLAASVVLLPALLDLSPIRRPPAPRPGAKPTPPERHRALILGTAAALGVASLFLVPRAEFDRNPINLREATSESVSTFLDLLAESERPPWAIVVLTDPQRVASLERRVEPLAEVDGAASILDFVPEDQDAKLALVDALDLMLGLVPPDVPAPAPASVDDTLGGIAALQAAIGGRLAAGGTLPPTFSHLVSTLDELDRRLGPGGGALLALLEENLLATLAHEIDGLRRALRAGPVTLADLPDALTRRWVSLDGRYRVEIFPAQNIQDPAALRRFVEAVRAVAPTATDSPVTLLESGNVVVAAFAQAMGTALALIGVLLIVLFRSVRDLLLVLTPLLLAAAFTIAAMVLLGISFNFANVITLPLLLGMGVDNGIHMVRRAHDEAVRAGRPAGAGAGNVLRTSTARAVIVSALTTVASFGNLGFSAHPGTASMGQVLTMGLAFNLLCTLVVLPVLIAWRRSRPTP